MIGFNFGEPTTIALVGVCLTFRAESNAEFLNVFASKNTSESHCEPTHGCEIRRRTFQSVDLWRLTRRQQSARVDAL
jgi:hypothetical protein